MKPKPRNSLLQLCKRKRWAVLVTFLKIKWIRSKEYKDFYDFPITPRFVISGEISCIYKQDGKVRKVHNVILLPSLDAAELLSLKLETIGNIRSDGRPILGLSSKDLLAITLEVCPEAVFIPAHIWTPHFSLFGAFSGFVMAAL